MVWMDHYSGDTGQTVIMDVMVSNAHTPIDSFVLDLSFDPTMIRFLSVDSCELDPSWMHFDAHAVSDGLIRMGGWSLFSSIPTGSSGCLVRLSFTVTCAECDYGDVTPLILSRFYDDISGFYPQNGSFAFMLADTPTPTPSPTPTITPGGPTRTPTPLPLMEIVQVDDYAGTTGEIVSVSIMVSNPNRSIDTFMIDLSYDSNMLAFMECHTGTLNPGWLMFDCSILESGAIRTAGFSIDNQIDPGNTGSIVILDFTVACNGCLAGDMCPLNIDALWDDLRAYPTEDGSFTFSGGDPPCVHHGDTNLDGSVTAADAQAAFLIALNLDIPTVTEACAADCNGDGEITAGDAQHIFAVSLGIEECSERHGSP